MSQAPRGDHQHLFILSHPSSREGHSLGDPGGGGHLGQQLLPHVLSQADGADGLYPGHCAVGIPPLLKPSAISETFSVLHYAETRHEPTGAPTGQVQLELVDQNNQLDSRKIFLGPAKDTNLYGCQFTRLGSNMRGPLDSGKWSKEESSLHSNLLEIRAICLALSQFQQLFLGKHLLVRMDNVAAKAHINKQGGSRSSILNKEALLILQWAKVHVESLSTEHVKGSVNKLSGSASKTYGKQNGLSTGDYSD